MSSVGSVEPIACVRPDRANWIGLWALYRREVRRFLAVAAQTVLGPVVTTLLFLVVFTVVMAGRGQPQTVGGVPYLDFLAPGLVMMAMAQNAFANSSSSILIGKVQGNITDFLMAPLSPAEFVAGFALGAVTRGLLVGGAVALAMRPFVPFGLAHPAFAALHALAACLLLALLGLWAAAPDPVWDGLPGLRHRARPDGVLAWLGRLLPPVGILVGVHLFWAGADHPGGAFQAGTVLAAVWTLAMMAGLADAPEPRRGDLVLARACHLSDGRVR